MQDVPRPHDSAQRGVCGLLIALIIFGIACRFIGLNWDEGAHLHPDERFLAMTLPELHWPNGWSNYFDTTRSPLNPLNKPDVHLYVYGQLPLTLVKLVADVLHRDTYDGVLLVGRALSALCDAGTVLLLIAIGCRCGGRLLGLTAAVLLALMPLHIQQSHFFVVDTFASFFQTLAFWCALGLLAPAATPRRLRRAAILTGGAWGAAMACKISSALFLLPIVALLVWGSRLEPEQRRRAWKFGFTQLLIVIGCGFATLRVLHPMAFAGQTGWLTLGGLFDIRPIVSSAEIAASRPLARLVALGVVADGYRDQFLGSLREQAAISAGLVDVPFNVQWVGRSFWFPLRNLAQWGMGWPITVCCLAGLAAVAVQRVRRRPVPSGVLVAALWTVFIYVYHARWFSKFTRYYLAMAPLAALCGAWLLVLIAQRAAGSPRLRQWRWTLPGVALTGAALWAVACASIYMRANPRLEATRWVNSNLMPGTLVANETAWDDTLPIGGGDRFKSSDLALFDADTEGKRRAMLATLDRVEWIFVTSNRVWGTVPRLPRRWPLTTAYYRALFAGELGFELAQDFTSYPSLRLGGWHLDFPDDGVEESLTVYDHPRVMIFRKTPTWLRARAEAVLAPGLVPAPEIPLLELHRSGAVAPPGETPHPPTR